MTPVDGFVLGVAATAIAGALVWAVTVAVIKAIQVANSLILGLSEIPQLRKANDELVKVFTSLRDEIRFFRTGIQAADEIPDSGTEPAAGPRTPAPFPAPVFDRFPQRPVEAVADATMEDSQVLSNTDEEMVAYERLEKLRDAGIEVEEPEDVEGIPKGIGADSE